MNKKEREWNDLAEGSRSRTERNNLKKVEKCPALVIALAIVRVASELFFALSFEERIMA